MSTIPEKHAETPSPRRGRWTLILLTLVVALPMLVSFVLYLSDWRPQGKSRHFGELIHPARPLPELTLHAATGDAVPLSALRRHWQLVYVGRSACDPACEAALDRIHRVRLAMGKEMRRVEHSFIVVDGNPAQWKKLADAHPGLRVLAADDTAVKALIPALAGNDGRAPQPGDMIYLVDPIGNLVLRYAADTDASGIRRDLARLLRLSQIG